MCQKREDNSEAAEKTTNEKTSKTLSDQNFDDLVSQISFPPTQQGADKKSHVGVFTGVPLQPACHRELSNGPPTPPAPPQRTLCLMELALWDADCTSRKREKALPPRIQSFDIIKRRTRARNSARVGGRRFGQQRISRKWGSQEAENRSTAGNYEYWSSSVVIKRHESEISFESFWTGPLG